MKRWRNSKINRVDSKSKIGALFNEFILGGQDGLVNVLGIVLGVSAASSNVQLAIVAGLAATFAEGFSMGAVAYTSSKAEESYYESQQEKEIREMKEEPKSETKEIYDIYRKKGFRGKLLNDIVKHITSNDKVWLNIMMKEELNLEKSQVNSLKKGIVVGLSTMVGSMIPIMSLFFLPMPTAIYVSVIVSAIALFITGALEAKINIGNWIRKGIQLMLIGMVAAVIGFAIGKLLGVSV
jgi:VIT1/CCC1 family predicted Fe2+/Mn2+ transporter